ncbi:MAG: hypothetical protein KDB10_22685 [Acidimicrobiales bacterium]|nr:hypothetical protein [Acidimicrobiales bacterium]
MTDTLLSELGGAEQLDQIVAAFYAKVVADPDLGPVFADVDVDRLVHMQEEFLGVAFGSSDHVADTDLRAAHARRAITGRQSPGSSSCSRTRWPSGACPGRPSNGWRTASPSTWTTSSASTATPAEPAPGRRRHPPNDVAAHGPATRSNHTSFPPRWRATRPRSARAWTTARASGRGTGRLRSPRS